jgi:K+-transporting ATPase ATPase A chain
MSSHSDGTKPGIGNFWIDVSKSLFAILLPIAGISSLLLIALGTVQNFLPNFLITSMENTSRFLMPEGPIASQTVIALLGNNGGGFLGTNLAHPCANPNMYTNYFQMILMLLLPISFLYYYAHYNKRQAYRIIGLSTLFFIGLTILLILLEQHMHAGKNLENISNYSIWNSISMATNTGANNIGPTVISPLGKVMVLIIMHFHQILFGALGLGLSNMILLIILTVFIAGMMVGLTPEFAGKKLRAIEAKYVILSVLMPPFCILVTITLLSSLYPQESFSSILYNLSSLLFNNGSMIPFKVLDINTETFCYLADALMLYGRFLPCIFIILLAETMQQQKPCLSAQVNHLKTESYIFLSIWLILSILITVLSFSPFWLLSSIESHVSNYI